jgi:hypothetical protein
MEETQIVLPWQGLVLEDVTSPILACPSGVGSGKSRLEVEWALHRGWLNSPIPTMLVEPTFNMVTDILLPLFEEVCDARKIRYRWVGPQGGGRKSSTITVMPGGGVPDYDILLRSADDPKRLDGKNIGAVGIDEAGQCKRGTIDRARRRARHPHARCRQLLLTGTPEKIDSEFYDWVEAKPQPGTRVIRADTNENTFLPDDYIEVNLSHLDEEDRQQYMRGFFVVKGSRAYRAFERTKHGVPCTRIGDRRIEVGADFNVGKMSWTCAVSNGDQGHVFGELVRYDTTTWDQGEALSKYLQDRIGRERGHVPAIEEVRRRTTIYCDPSARNRHTGASESDVNQLRRQGYDVRVEHQTIDVKDRVMSVNWRFRSEPALLLVDVAACPKLTEALERQGRDADGRPVKDRDPKKDMSAETDALGYWIWTGHPSWRATVPQGNSLHIGGYR